MIIKFHYLTFDPPVSWKLQIWMKEDNSYTLPRVNYLGHLIGRNTYTDNN